ncbi:MAG: MFS transporter [Candidatus Promineifilaceae bacterium]|jgi:fucose permease
MKRIKVKKLDIATWASFIMFAASAIIVAICLPEISKTFSTNLAEGGGLETARSVIILITLLLAGILSQRLGKKKLLAGGQYMITAGLLLGSVAQNYLTIILAVMLMGAGAGLSEALLNPLIIDLHPRESGRYLNIGHAFYPVGVMTFALFFGELLTQGTSWRFVFQIAAVGTLAVAVLFTVLTFPAEKTEIKINSRLFTSILGRGAFWLFAAAILLGAAIESGFTFWSRTYVGFYLSDIPRAGAIAVVLFAAAMAIGRFLSGYLANKTSLSNIMIGSGLLGLVVSALIPLSATLWGFYGLLALAGLATACFWPTIMAEADNYLLTANSTLLFILLACAGIIGFGLTPWILGLIGDSSGLKVGFVLIPILFIALILVLVFERRLSSRQFKAAPGRL